MKGFAGMAAVLLLVQIPAPHPTGRPAIVSNQTSTWPGNGCGPNGDGDCVLKTSFTTADGWAQDVGQQITGGGSCPAYGGASGGNGFTGHQSGFATGGNNTIDGGTTCDAVITAANHSTGAGGRGFRHYRCDGDNCTGGGMIVNIPNNPSKMWMSYVMRWSSALTLGSPAFYAKDMYFQSSKPYVVWGMQSAGPGFDVNGTFNSCCSGSMLTWNSYNGGRNNGDNKWHCWDIFADAPNNKTTLWIDGVKQYDGNPTTSIVGATFGGAQWGNNEDFISGCAASGSNLNCYTDYDDLKVSTSLGTGQRIGCAGGSS